MSARRSKSDVWMPIYIGDYLADTMRLSTVQHGAYFLLMMEYWRQGPLPDNADELSAIVRADRKTWDKSIWPILKRYFTLGDDGLLHQKRADEERANASGLKAKRAAAAQARWNKTTEQETCKTDANASANHTDVDEQNGCITHALRASASPSPSPSSLRSEHSSLRSERESAPDDATPAPSKTSQRRKSQLPEDWQPSPDELSYAQNLGLDGRAVAENFRLHWRSKGETKLDWHAAFQLWCRREQSFTGGRPAGTGFVPRPKTAAQNADENARYLLERFGAGQ